MKQSRRASLCETAVNTGLGVVINWSVLVGVYGQPLAATGVTLAMVGVSSLRLYAVRRLFEAFRDTQTRLCIKDGLS